MHLRLEFRLADENVAVFGGLIVNYELMVV